jgi:pyruvate/2-oxoglutarate dehydrogenase complex dihydrolipoamide dehydrogenase (E3) component
MDRNNRPNPRSMPAPAVPEMAKKGGWWRPLVLVAPLLAILVLARVFGLGEKLGAWRGWIESDAVSNGLSQGRIPWALIGATLGVAAVLAVLVTLARRKLQAQEMKLKVPVPPEPQAEPLAIPEVQPLDEYNRELLANVHPPDWVNPEPAGSYNLVVIGAGTAGLVSAAGAAGLGAKVALIERHYLGGDCLNYGCVPSKAIIRSARAVAALRDAARYGVEAPDNFKVDFGAVMARMRRLRAGISHHDSALRFRDLGVDVFLGQAKFLSGDSVEVDGKVLRFKRAVIATGARAVQPQIEGMAEAGFLTNETVFSLTELPTRLAVMGAGPIGCEFAQACQRLGSQVTLLHKYDRIMNKEDADAAAVIQGVFQREGINLILNYQPVRVRKTETGKVIEYISNGQPGILEVDEILIGAGRTPNVEGLNLEAAEVVYEPGKGRGVLVNDHLQTSNHRIYAAGDICSPYQFTHTADFQARLVIQNALFFGRRKMSTLVIPWCTYTDPEVAHVGLSEAAAQKQDIKYTVFTRDLKDVDRAIVDGDEAGFVKVLVKKDSDKILGATIVARHGGEMISEITTAMVAGLGLGGLANVIHPYPTQAEAIRQTGDLYNRTRLTPRVKNLFSLFLKWRR